MEWDGIVRREKRNPKRRNPREFQTGFPSLLGPGFVSLPWDSMEALEGHLRFQGAASQFREPDLWALAVVAWE